MSKPFIVIGDKSSHGGIVVGGATTVITHGKQVARVTDKVTCPKCGPTTIATGDSTMIVMGQPVARHGDKTACGATLIAGQSATTGGAGGGGATAATKPASERHAQSITGSSNPAGNATVSPVSALAPQSGTESSAPAQEATQLVPVTLPGLGETYLDASVKPHVEQFISNAAAHDVQLHFNSAYRSTKHQAALKNDPNAITPATTSLHSCGFAVDVNYSTLPASQRSIIRQAAKDAELKWGGDFQHPDPPHFYMDPPVPRKTAIQTATKQYDDMKGGH